LFTELHKALDVEDHDEENVARVSETQFFIKTAEGEPVWQDRFSVIFFRKKKVFEIPELLKFPDISSWFILKFPTSTAFRTSAETLGCQAQERLKGSTRIPWLPHLEEKNTGMCIEKNDYMI
jgi:hypothetical protein